MANSFLSRLSRMVDKSRRLGNEPVYQTKRKPSSEYSKSIFSRAFFTWALRIIRTANFRRLLIEDFEYVNPDRTVTAKHGAFQKAWTTHTKKAEATNPLLWALLATYRAQFLAAVIMCLTSIGGKLASVVLYKLIIEYLQQSHDRDGNHNPSLGKGVALLFATDCAVFICALIRIHYMTAMSLIGGEIKTLLGDLMFEKSFVISPLARRLKRSVKRKKDDWGEAVENPDDNAWTQGAIINSMNSNTDRIEASMDTLSHLIGLITTLPMTIGLGWWLLGWAGIVGMLVGFIMLPFLCFLLSPISRLRQRINILTEERVDLVNDIVKAIRLIKYCAWEDVFSKKFESIRRREVAASARLVAAVCAMIIFLSVASNAPNLVATAIYTHFHFGNSTLVVMPYFYLAILFRRFVHRVPNAIIDAINAYNALLDIQEFLRAKEETPGKGFIIAPELGQAIVLQNARFVWNKRLQIESSNTDSLVAESPSLEKEEYVGNSHSQSVFQLKPLDLMVGAHELVAIVGQVGSGKSSLAAALVGDMVHEDGKVSLRSKPSYCPQTPWIQNATVRENIVFGLRYDEEWYRKIVHACALEQDLLDLTDGDRTILGELGVNISGGQKQRIQLARTLYQNRDIVILDDPLSAVDAHTGEHVFDYAIQSLLAKKCCLLVSQQLNVLARCSRIVWLEVGGIKATGTLDELSQLPRFNQFLGNCEQRRALDDDTARGGTETCVANSELSSQLQLMQEEEVKAGRLQWR